MKGFDISVVGELNADLILYGLPAALEPEREHLAEDFAITLGSSSAIFAHNIALLGSRVGFTSCIGGDALGKFCVDRLQDTVGAGDSFNAGFLHKFILRCNLEECLEYGNAVAALSTTRAGGTEALRDSARRESFLLVSASTRKGGIS